MAQDPATIVAGIFQQRNDRLQTTVRVLRTTFQHVKGIAEQLDLSIVRLRAYTKKQLREKLEVVKMHYRRDY